MNRMLTFRLGDILRFNYKNHRGENSTRNVRFEGLDYGRNEWYPEPGWFMRTFDLDKQKARSFRFENMLSPPTFLQEGPENKMERAQSYMDMFNSKEALLFGVENPDAFHILPDVTPNTPFITWYAGMGLNHDGSITYYGKDQLNKPKERFGEDMDD